MTVAELIATLSEYPAHATVTLASAWGEGCWLDVVLHDGSGGRSVSVMEGE